MVVTMPYVSMDSVHHVLSSLLWFVSINSLTQVMAKTMRWDWLSAVVSVSGESMMNFIFAVVGVETVMPY